MPRFLIALALLLITTIAHASFLSAGAPAFGAPTNDPVQGFRLESAISMGDAVEVTLSVAPGFSLYKSSLKFLSLGSEIKPTLMPEGTIKEDPAFGRIEVYHGTVAIELPLVVDRTLVVKLQGCLDTGLCFEEQTRQVQIEGPLPDHIDTAAPHSLWWFALAGVLLAFTPCVLPTLPLMLHAISGDKQGRASQASLGMTYGLFSALSYAALGVAIGFLGARYDLRAGLQAPIPVLVVSGLLAMLAALNLGLRLPLLSGMRLDGLSSYFHGMKGGTFSGAALMGVVSTLMLSPCVTAPLAGVMLYLAQSGSPLYAGLCLFTLGVGMALPMIVLAVGGKRFIPKSGPWLIFMKEASAMLLLGAALINASRLLSGAQTLVLIGVASFLLAAYARVRLPSVGRGIVRASLVFLLFAYGFVCVGGGLNGQDDWRKPLAVPVHLVDVTLTDPGMIQKSIVNGAPAVVMVSAQWCLNCKVLEREMAEDNVRAAYPGIPWIKVDITHPSEAMSQWLKDQSLFGPPALLFFNREGREVVDLRLIGTVHPDQVRKSLDVILRP